MRQSTVHGRISHANTTSSQPNATVSAAKQAKLLEKRKEYEAVTALERASALLVNRIEGLGEDFDVMADAGQVHGQVLEQWPNMFRILGLFLAARDRAAASTEISADEANIGGERLVRIPIEDLQTASKE